MSVKNVVSGNLVVNMSCRAFDSTWFKVYDRSTGHTHELRQMDDGRILRGWSEPSPAEIAAVQAFIFAEGQDFLKWLADRPQNAPYVDQAFIDSMAV